MIVDWTEDEYERASSFVAAFNSMNITFKAILGMLAEGYTNVEIAKRLGIKLDVIKQYTKQIYSLLLIEDCYNKRAYCAMMYSKLFAFQQVRALVGRPYHTAGSVGRGRRYEDKGRYVNAVADERLAVGAGSRQA